MRRDKKRRKRRTGGSHSPITTYMEKREGETEIGTEVEDKERRRRDEE